MVGLQSDSRVIFLYNLLVLNIDNLISLMRSSKKTLFILCGLPYAGKTYVASKLNAQTSIESVSIDDIFHKHGFNWDVGILPNPEEWRLIFNESYGKAKKALIQGENVLYDSTNQTIESRNMLRELADSVGADTSIVYVKSPVDTVWKRWEENQKKHSRHSVSRDLVQMTIDMFEEPTEEEGVLFNIENF